MPATRETAAFVRLAHPHIYGLYYNASDTIQPWQERNYTRWPIAEWEGKFGRTVDQENRKWEFFGYTIPLYDDVKT